jgi:hypothetical protein
MLPQGFNLLGNSELINLVDHEDSGEIGSLGDVR